MTSDPKPNKIYQRELVVHSAFEKLNRGCIKKEKENFIYDNFCQMLTFSLGLMAMFDRECKKGWIGIINKYDPYLKQ